MEIGDYSLRTWGEDQAIRYNGDLELCCKQLVNNPELGRVCDHVRPGLRRMEHGRHVVFYRRDADGILISRILHQRMVPEKYLIGAEDQ